MPSSPSSQPITYISRIPRSYRELRVIWHIAAAILVAVALQHPFAASAEAGQRRARLSADLATRLSSNAAGDVDVIVSGSIEKIDRLARRHNLRIRKNLSSGAVFSVSRQALDALSQDLEVEALSGNATVRSSMAITTQFTGAEAAWSGAITSLGKVNGSGIGVAVIDSGIDWKHPALQNRVIASVDFTDARGRGEDLYGHGTHIAGIIAARKFNNSATGADSGMAPAAHLINLKVLGADGSGEAADVIEAIDFAVKYRAQLGIRIINLSLGAAPTQSYKDDPICLAVERAVKAGIVVVASAGNYGSTEDGKLVYGSVTSPGISPYAITVGATRTQGTLDPSDDEVAPWSSKGPTLIDHIVKPDLVAPGSKIVSTATKGSTLSGMYPERFNDGPGGRDYLWLSGTSMSAAVVSGAAALLLDGKRGLTPLQVKIALQASADAMQSGGLVISGAGSLDLRDIDSLNYLPVSKNGVETAYSITVADQFGAESQVIIWGTVIIWGSDLPPDYAIANDVIIWGSWTAQDVIIWGAETTAADVIIWGEAASSQDVIIWGSAATQDVIIWGAGTPRAQDVIIWGSASNANDVIIWGAAARAKDVIIWGSSTRAEDVIIWGSGSNSQDVIIWGSSNPLTWWGY